MPLKGSLLLLTVPLETEAHIHAGPDGKAPESGRRSKRKGKAQATSFIAILGGKAGPGNSLGLASLNNGSRV